MKSIRRSVKFTNPELGLQFLKALAFVAVNKFYNATSDYNVPMYLLADYKELRPRKNLTFLIGLGDVRNPQLYALEPTESMQENHLVVADCKRETFYELCDYLATGEKLAKEIFAALSLPIKTQSLKSYMDMSRTRTFPKPSLEENGNLETYILQKEINPLVVSKKRIKKHGTSDLQPTAIKRRVTLCLQVDRETLSYSIGHSIHRPVKGYPYSDSKGVRIAQNRAAKAEHAMLFKTMDSLSRVCFRDTLLSNEGKEKMLESIFADMEQNYGNYVAAYNHNS